MIVFTIAYALVSLCFVAPPREFVSAGLTVQNILSGYLGSEDMDFVGYHLKRTTSTVLLHSLLPLGKHDHQAKLVRYIYIYIYFFFTILFDIQIPSPLY